MDRDRRALLRSIALAGSAGVAGCFGGPAGGDPTATAPGPTEGSPAERSPTDTPVQTETPTPSPTPTPVRECLCVDPASLLSFDERELSVPAGTTTTLTGRIHNPYLFELVSIEITLHPPDGDWSITPVRNTSIGSWLPRPSARRRGS